jgi:ribosomal protein L11 methyltransferase
VFHVDKLWLNPGDSARQKSIFIAMDYLLLAIIVSPLDPFRDLLSYRLAECGCDMFEETEEGLKAYAPLRDYQREEANAVFDECRELGATIALTEEVIAWKNWNEEWEKQYQPEIIADTIYIRADFHPPNPGFPMEILIQPRMAFGTGHHPTTSQVMEMMLKMDFKDKKVIDMGCGTGILAIQAMMQGASEAIAIDNDPNAVENTRDNLIKNNTLHTHVIEGDASALKGKYCDVFIANINRNIILNDLANYKACMRPGAELITSGYYVQDLPMIQKKAAELGIHYVDHTVDKDWCCALFKL